MKQLPPLDLQALFHAHPHELAERLTLAFALERPTLLRAARRPRIAPSTHQPPKKNERHG